MSFWLAKPRCISVGQSSPCSGDGELRTSGESAPKRVSCMNKGAKAQSALKLWDRRAEIYCTKLCPNLGRVGHWRVVATGHWRVVATGHWRVVATGHLNLGIARLMVTRPKYTRPGCKLVWCQAGQV